MNDAFTPRRRADPYLRLLCVLCSTWILLGAWSRLAPGSVPLGRPVPRLPDARSLALAQTHAPAGPEAAQHGAAAEPPGGGRDPGAGPADARSGPVHGPQRILLFGDSMVPVLAPRLADYCLENGHELFPAVWYGSTIIYWAWQDRLDQLLGELRPTVVIAALGSSELAVREVGECEPYVHAIVRKVGARKLVWVGPPNWRDDTGVNALLERALGPGRFFRSDRLELPRRADGIHPTAEAGAMWVESLVRWMADDSTALLVLAPPTRAAPPVAARVFPPPF